MSRKEQTSAFPEKAAHKYGGSLWILMAGCLKAAAVYALGVLVLAAFAGFWAASQLKLILVKAWVYHRTGKAFDILSGADASANYLGASVFTDPSCPMVLNGGETLRGVMDFGKFVQRVKEHVVDDVDPRTGRKVYPRFTQKVVRKYGYYVWVDDEGFSMADKVRLHDEKYEDDAALVGMIQQAHGVPLPKDRSPWEFLLFQKASHDEYTVLLRVHHSLGDGVNMLLVCQALTDRDSLSQQQKIEFTKHARASRLPPVIRHNPLLRYLQSPGGKPTAPDVIEITLNALRILLATPWHAVAPLFYRKETNALNTPTALLSGRKLMAMSEPVDLQLLKDVAARYQCSFNDVFLYCLTGAFQRRNAAAPISTDATARVLLLIFLLPPRTSWSQNGLAYSVVDLPVRHADRVPRLKAISRICQEVLSSPAPICNFLLVHAFGNHLPLALARHVFVTCVKFSMMSSNVCGPAYRPLALGHPMTDVYFLPNNLNNSGVSFGMLSCQGHARITVTVDRAVSVDDNTAQQLVDDFLDELKTIHAMAQNTVQ